jgi:hypothetical protein
MARVAFPLSTFQDSDGNPVGFGRVLVNLSTDVQTPTPQQIAASLVATINLDINGATLGTPEVWPNSELTPSGSVYIYSVFSQLGQEIVREATLTV